MYHKMVISSDFAELCLQTRRGSGVGEGNRDNGTYGSQHTLFLSTECTTVNQLVKKCAYCPFK